MRDKPIVDNISPADKPISKRLLAGLHLLLIAGAIPVIALINPALFEYLMHAVWPFLGAAIYVLTLSVYALLRRD